jgi:hypothetical protein
VIESEQTFLEEIQKCRSSIPPISELMTIEAAIVKVSLSLMHHGPDSANRNKARIQYHSVSPSPLRDFNQITPNRPPKATLAMTDDINAKNPMVTIPMSRVTASRDRMRFLMIYSVEIFNQRNQQEMKSGANRTDV